MQLGTRLHLSSSHIPQYGFKIPSPGSPGSLCKRQYGFAVPSPGFSPARLQPNVTQLNRWSNIMIVIVMIIVEIICHHRCHDDCRRTSFVARSAKQSIGSWELCRRHQQVCNFVLILILTLILIFILVFILILIVIFILTIEIQSESGDISRNYLLSSQLTQKIWTQQPNTLKAYFRQIAKTMFQTLIEWLSYVTSYNSNYNTSLKFVFCLSETSQWFWRDFSKTMKKLIDQKTKVLWKTIKC